MFLVAVDAYSKWPHIVITHSCEDHRRTSRDVLDVWCARASRYGQWSTVRVGRICCFPLLVMDTRSTPYHPATNGLAERFVQSFKQGLKVSQSSGLSLNCRLSYYLLLYRSTPHSTTGVTPSSLFLKREMRTRFDLLRPDQEAEVSRKQER